MEHAGTTTLLRSSFLFLAFGSLAVALPAQSLTQQDQLPAIGSSWHMRALQVVPVDELLIEPITWAYGNLVGNDVFGATYTVLDPSTVAGHSAYETADRAIRKVADNDPAPSHTFYEVQDDRVLELGTLGPVFNTYFRPSTMALAYPLDLNGSKQDEFCFVSNSGGSNTAYCGSTRISLDARGTLELPFGTYVNAQLVTTRRATALQSTTDSTISVTKDWYVAGTPFPVLHLVALTSYDGSTSRNGQIVDEASLVGIAEHRRADPLVLYPNPTTGSITLDDIESGTLEIIASDGRLVKTQRIMAAQPRITLELDDLPNGIYQVAMRGNNVRRSTRVVVAR